MYLKKSRKERIQSALKGWKTRRFNLLITKTYQFSVKIFSVFALGICVASCAMDQYRHLEPDHIGLNASIGVDLEEGCKAVKKPLVGVVLDWNL